MLNLAALFSSLKAIPSPEGSHILASPVPGFENHRIARDVQGSPLILIAVPRGRARTRPVPIKLEHLSIQHDMECRISGIDGVIEEGQFTVIACLGDDPVLHTYFLRVLESVVMLLGPTPTRSDITRAVFSLVELFRAMTAAPHKSVQGLWAELFLMARASDVAVMAQAWHTTPEDRYDFNFADQRIEVKSAGNRVRQHQFSLEQLQSPPGVSVLVASIFVERAGSGTSLAEILDKVRVRIGNDLEQLMTLDRIVGMTLGNTWRQAMDERFDYELARHSLAFYETSAIPAVSAKMPAEVSNVRFNSDLSAVNPADIALHRSAGGLFHAAL